MKNEVSQVDGKFYKKSKVVILPTEKVSYPFIGMYYDNGKESLTYVAGNHNNSALTQPQHLYFLSDEKIQEGDWVVTQKTTDKEDGYEVAQIKSREIIKDGGECITFLGISVGNKTSITKTVKYKYFSEFHGHDVIAEDCKKIIATTDESLGLPRPSNEFLKKYCELSGIDEALVEYEYNHDDTVPFPKTIEGQEVKIKVAPDNTITIKPIKDSWSREEVVKLIKEFHNCICDHPARSVNNWIEENL